MATMLQNTVWNIIHIKDIGILFRQSIVPLHARPLMIRGLWRGLSRQANSNFTDVYSSSGLIDEYLDLIHLTIWWRHQIETFSASLTICAGKWPVLSRKQLNWFLICFLTKGIFGLKSVKYLVRIACHSVACLNLTHWGRVTHICVSKLTIIVSDNGLSPGRHQAWTKAGILLIGPLGTVKY